jgi:hypothetical protein
MACHRLGRGVGKEFVSAVFVLAGQEAIITAIAFGYIHNHSISRHGPIPRLDIFKQIFLEVASSET